MSNEDNKVLHNKYVKSLERQIKECKETESMLSNLLDTHLRNKLHLTSFKIDSWLHEMIAKGTCSSEPTIEDITSFLCNEGWAVKGEIEINKCDDDWVCEWEWDCIITIGK